MNMGAVFPVSGAVWVTSHKLHDSRTQGKHVCFLVPSLAVTVVRQYGRAQVSVVPLVVVLTDIDGARALAKVVA